MRMRDKDEEKGRQLRQGQRTMTREVNNNKDVGQGTRTRRDKDEYEDIKNG